MENWEEKTQQFGELTYQKLKKSAGLFPQVWNMCMVCTVAYNTCLQCIVSLYSLIIALRLSVKHLLMFFWLNWLVEILCQGMSLFATPFLTNAEAFTPGKKIIKASLLKLSL